MVFIKYILHRPFLKIGKRGFTLTELLVSIAIFAFMTALVLARYDKFNGGILLTNLAYDVALTIRQAQSFALNVQQTDVSGTFLAPYGARFSMASGTGGDVNSTKFLLYADNFPIGSCATCVAGDYSYTAGSDKKVASYSIKRGNVISSICIGTSSACTVTLTNNSNPNYVDIFFKRPDPDAIIVYNNDSTTYRYARITIRSSDGTERNIVVQKTGLISIQ